jgi:HPt (histidine-containing phosphotransfer) domain-containing protein
MSDQSREQVLDTERLRMLFSDDRDLLNEIYEIISTDFPENARLLNGAVESGDFEQITRYAHTLKGSIANIGGNRASGVCDRIHAASKQEDIALCRSLLPEFNTQFDNFIEAFHRYVHGDS